MQDRSEILDPCTKDVKMLVCEWLNAWNFEYVILVGIYQGWTVLVNVGIQKVFILDMCYV